MAKPMYVRFEMPKELVDKTYQAIELAKDAIAAGKQAAISLHRKVAPGIVR